MPGMSVQQTNTVARSPETSWNLSLKWETQVLEEVHFCSNLNTDIDGLRLMLISCLMHDLKWRKLIY